MTDKEKVDKTLEVIKAIYKTIKQAGPLGAPSGMLYAACMPVMGLDTYQSIIEVLIESGGIENHNDCLVAVNR